jgi:hypothetical protein
MLSPAESENFYSCGPLRGSAACSINSTGSSFIDNGAALRIPNTAAKDVLKVVVTQSAVSVTPGVAVTLRESLSTAGQYAQTFNTGLQSSGPPVLNLSHAGIVLNGSTAATASILNTYTYTPQMPVVSLTAQVDLVLAPGMTDMSPNNPFSFTYQVQSVAVVPEPETYAMLLAGLGIVVLAARRRQRARAIGA